MQSLHVSTVVGRDFDDAVSSLAFRLDDAESLTSLLVDGSCNLIRFRIRSSNES